MQHFFFCFRRNNYVNNDHKVGQMLKRLIVDEMVWNKICKTPPRHEDTRGSLGGIKHLLKMMQLDSAVVSALGT